MKKIITNTYKYNLTNSGLVTSCTKNLKMQIPFNMQKETHLLYLTSFFLKNYDFQYYGKKRTLSFYFKLYYEHFRFLKFYVKKK